MRSMTGMNVSSTNRKGTRKNKKKNSLCKKIVCYLFESFSASFSDLDNAMEMYAQINSDETKDALEWSYDTEFQVQLKFIFPTDSISGFPFINVKLAMDDPKYDSVLGIEGSNYILTVTREYYEDINPDAIFESLRTYLSDDKGVIEFIATDEEQDYNYIISGGILLIDFNPTTSPTAIPTRSPFELGEPIDAVPSLAPTPYIETMVPTGSPTKLSNAASSLLSESLGVDIQLEDDSVIFFFIYFLIVSRNSKFQVLSNWFCK